MPSNGPRCSRYEKIYTHRLQAAAPTVAYRATLGIGIGWFPLLERVQGKPEAISLRRPFKVLHIQSKLGRLEVILDAEVPEAEVLLATAASESETICELCGGSGQWREVPRHCFGQLSAYILCDEDDLDR